MMMSDARRIRFGQWATGVSVIVILGALVAVAAMGRWNVATSVLAPINGLLGAGFGALAWTILPKQPRNAAVWAYAWASIFGAIFVGGVLILVLTAPTPILDDFDGVKILAELPLVAAITASIMIWAWIPVLLLPLTFGLLLFPDGQLVSPRWGWVGKVALATMIASIGCLWVLFNPWTTVPLDTYDTPLGMISEVLLLILSLIALVSAASLVVRYRRSGEILRRQIRWIAAGGFLFVACHGFVVFASGGFAIAGDVPTSAIYLLASICLVGSFWIAITRYRLYDIDIVISKTLTYGALAGFITGVYSLIVVGVGSLVGSRDEPSLALSIAAVAIVAVAFEPLRSRIQHWANRLVYGKRATPYEVLAGTTARLSGASDPDHALAEIAQLMVDGTGATEAAIWLAVGGALLPRVATPESALTNLHPVDVSDDAMDRIPGDRVVAVRHRGELLGAMSISKSRDEGVTGADERVLADVAAGAGGLLRNIALNAELAERADQLRESRRRLVVAHDAERHRLERDLHDGAQQQVVAIKVKLGIARTLAQREGAESVAGLVASLSDTTQAAVDGMRAVAHGIYPPLLEAEGLEAALASARRTIAIPVEMAVERLGRYERSVEESVYFCVLGVIAGAVDAGATRVGISLHGSSDAVTFSVDADRAPSDVVAVEDRIDALGGSLQINRETDHAVVVGELPAPSRSMELV